MRNPSRNDQVNYTTKHISEFTPDDTIYITRMAGGYRYIYYCQFIKYERGMVYGKPISWEPQWAHRATDLPDIVKARLKSCFLWGVGGGLGHPYAHWFNKNGTVKSE